MLLLTEEVQSHFSDSYGVSSKVVALKVNLNVIPKTLNWIQVPDLFLKHL